MEFYKDTIFRIFLSGIKHHISKHQAEQIVFCLLKQTLHMYRLRLKHALAPVHCTTIGFFKYSTRTQFIYIRELGTFLLLRLNVEDKGKRLLRKSSKKVKNFTHPPNPPPVKNSAKNRDTPFFT